MQQARTEKNSTNDKKNSDKDLNYLFEATMSDGGDLDIIETRQHVSTKLIITLVVQCSDKQTLQTINTQLGPTIQLKKMLIRATKPVLLLTQQHEPVNKL